MKATVEKPRTDQSGKRLIACPDVWHLRGRWSIIPEWYGRFALVVWGKALRTSKKQTVAACAAAW